MTDTRAAAKSGHVLPQHCYEWSEWGKEFVFFPRKINGRWHFCRRLLVSRRAYDNPFALLGVAFHRRYRLPAG